MLAFAVCWRKLQRLNKLPGSRGMQVRYFLLINTYKDSDNGKLVFDEHNGKCYKYIICKKKVVKRLKANSLCTTSKSVHFFSVLCSKNSLNAYLSNLPNFSIVSQFKQRFPGLTILVCFLLVITEPLCFFCLHLFKHHNCLLFMYTYWTFWAAVT